MKSHLRITIFIAFSFLLGACATQKKKEDRSLLNKFYHNETAYYNGYFNANVLYENSVMTLQQGYQDNYTDILDVYDYVNVSNPEVVKQDVDKAMEKLTVVVALHRHSVWTDDCYLLVGKSQYLKHDYESSEETLEYLREVYSPEAMAFRKNQKSRKQKLKDREKERKVKKKEKEQEKEEKKKERDTAKKEKEKTAKQKAKERKKEAARKQKERKKEAEARAKARKKGQKLPPKENVTQSDIPKTEEAPAEPVVAPPVETPPVPAPVEPDPAATPEPGLAEDPATGGIEREKYFFRHRPAYADAMLWLGRTYTERQMYDEAMRSFSDAFRQPSASKKTLREIPVAQAHLYLKQGLYDEAIPHLQQAISLAKKKKHKARYYYIIGQIQQRNGQLAEAANSFALVRKNRPGYEMDFNARLNQTLTGWMAGQTGPDEARRQLQKMLRDKKNVDYKDRIYYAMGDLDLHQYDTIAAIENYRQSLTFNPQNKPQRAATQMKLADLYYGKEEYIEAKVYYEGALENLAVNDERYERASRLARNLSDIAKHLSTIRLQDSLLMIAGMSERDQIELAEKIKEDRLAAAKEKENAKQASDQQDKNAGLAQSVNQNVLPSQRTPSGSGPAAKSTFFAYDPKTRERGIKDFQKQWGNRPLVDNWRQSAKMVSVAAAEEETKEDEVSTSLTKTEIQDIFKDVPFTEEAQADAHGQIQDAMIALGRLYRERLDYPAKSVDILNKLLTKYPDTEHELDAWYYLYLAHQDLGQQPEMKKYYDLIIGKYPESTYARVLSDPNYLGEEKEKERKLNEYYRVTYEFFEQGRYSATWKRIGEVESLFGKNNKYEVKFALLGAMTRGNIEGKDAYIDELKSLVTKYPETPEEKRAKEILRLLGDKSVTPKEIPGMESQDDKFNLDPEGVHYIIINWDMKDASVDAVQLAINEFNKQYFKADRLRLSANIFLDIDVPLIVIRKFDTASKAMEFYNLAYKYPDTFIGKGGISFKVYPVTQQNYRVILKNRSLEAYDTFFRENYK